MRLRVVAKGQSITIKLEDKMSGELFASCPVDAYPGVAVEAVMDSSRYFVLRLLGDGGRVLNNPSPSGPPRSDVIFSGICFVNAPRLARITWGNEIICSALDFDLDSLLNTPEMKISYH